MACWINRNNGEVTRHLQVLVYSIVEYTVSGFVLYVSFSALQAQYVKMSCSRWWPCDGCLSSGTVFVSRYLSRGGRRAYETIIVNTSKQLVSYNWLLISSMLISNLPATISNTGLECVIFNASLMRWNCTIVPFWSLDTIPQCQHVVRFFSPVLFDLAR